MDCETLGIVLAGLKIVLMEFEHKDSIEIKSQGRAQPLLHSNEKVRRAG
jgi:hypothetical protein